MANHEDYNDEDVEEKTEKILSDNNNKTRPGKLFHEHLATMAAMILL